jgi:hypothetical protein
MPLAYIRKEREVQAGTAAGRRPGPHPQWDERLHVQVNAEILEELDKIAEEQALTRSALVRRVLLDLIREAKEARVRTARE